MLNLKLIEAFYWVARLSSFRGAADRVLVSQPTVTYRVKELERQLGRSLLVRNTQTVRLTPQGQALFNEAERLLMLAQDIQRQMKPDQTISGLLRLGVMDAFAAVCLPYLLRRLAEQHPALNVSVVVDLSHALTLKLDAGELDLAVVSSPPVLTGLRYERLGAQSVGWVASPELGDGLTDPVSVSKQRVFVTPPPSNLMTLTSDWFRDAGLGPPAFSICNSMSAIVRLVTAGAGIGIMPLKLVDDALASGRLRHLAGLPPVNAQEIFIVLPGGVLDLSVPVTMDAIRVLVREKAFSE